MLDQPAAIAAILVCLVWIACGIASAATSPARREPTSLCPRCKSITWTGGLCPRCEDAAL